MKFKKSSPEIVERFEAALPSHPDVEPRSMFGYPAAWVNGNYFAGLFEESVVLRLPGALLGAVPEMRGAEPFNPMGTGRGMSGWYVVPERYARDVGPLAVLLERALGPVRAQPPKVRKAKGKQRPGSAKAEAASTRVTSPGTPAAKRAAAKKTSVAKRAAAKQPVAKKRGR